MRIHVLVLCDIVSVSVACLVVVPDKPNDHKSEACICLNHHADAGLSKEFPKPVCTSYKIKSIVLKNGELRNALNYIGSAQLAF